MLIKKKEANPLDRKVIDNLRGLSIDVINNASSGHPGISLGAAPIIYTLYANHLRFDLNNPKFVNRDRFVLSAGHASSLLYSTLHMAGFDISLEELQKFRKVGSKTPGHPELGITDGVDMSTGPLGQGIANAVGMALSRRYLNKRFDDKIFDFDVYALCGDGDLMEGVSYEACSLAGNLKLDNLILLYDSNSVTLDGPLSETFNENIKERFEAISWHYILVNDGEDVISIDDAIKEAKSVHLPTIIEIKTTIGKFSKKEGTNLVHGGPLDSEDTANIKEKLGLRNIPFQVSNEAVNYFRETINARNGQVVDNWMQKCMNLDEHDKELLNLLQDETSSIDLKDLYYEIPENNIESTKVTSNKIVKSLVTKYPFIVGGSADVASSTMLDLTDDPGNINFGVREHAMAAISNGLASMNLRPIISTFLAFSDYLKPALRMSALMNLPVIYIFSITSFEDGPTHQAIEQLTGLRAIPNLDVYYPADANEVLGSYKEILKNRKPAVLVLNKLDVPILESTKVSEVKNGAYIVRSESKRMDGTIISNGEYLHNAINIANKLKEKGLDIRVVSMPSIERFNQTSEDYQKEILPKKKITFVIDGSSSYSWYQFVDNKSHLFTNDSFGLSGNYQDVLKEKKLDENYIELRIEELLK